MQFNLHKTKSKTANHQTFVVVFKSYHNHWNKSSKSN